MEVKIEVGQPVAMPADNAGPAYNLYPVTVTGTHDKRLLRSTLSIDGSGVHQHPGAQLKYQVSSRDYESGTRKLFASVTDGDTTATAESQLNIALGKAKAQATTTSPPPASTGTPAK